jgi:UDP-N-acetylglucosamine 4,6-dehydratase
VGASKGTRFSVVRYGNVVGSRGSVLPLFLEGRQTGVIRITDRRMTRFWLTLDRATRFVLQCLERMEGGELYVPKIPSMRITDLAQAVAPGARHEIVGIRPGEKLHEMMIPREDSRRAVDCGDHYVLEPQFPFFDRAGSNGEPVPEGFEYSSDSNDSWLTAADLREMLSDEVDAAASRAPVPRTLSTTGAVATAFRPRLAALR